jgi:hypothetical protein
MPGFYQNKIVTAPHCQLDCTTMSRFHSKWNWYLQSNFYRQLHCCELRQAVHKFQTLSCTSIHSVHFRSMPRLSRHSSCLGVHSEQATDLSNHTLCNGSQTKVKWTKLLSLLDNFQRMTEYLLYGKMLLMIIHIQWREKVCEPFWKYGSMHKLVIQFDLSHNRKTQSD